MFDVRGSRFTVRTSNQALRTPNLNREHEPGTRNPERGTALRQFVSLQSAIECRTTQTKRLGSECDVAMTRHRLADEQRFDVLEAHFVQVLTHGDGRAQ